MENLDPNDPLVRQYTAEMILEAAMVGDWGTVVALEKFIVDGAGPIPPIAIPQPSPDIHRSNVTPVPPIVNPETSNVNRYVPPNPLT